MSELAFLTPVAALAAHSPMAAAAARMGARFEPRDGWETAVEFGDRDAERGRMRDTVALVDRSPVRKLELHGLTAPPPLGSAVERDDGAWLCAITPERTLVLGGSCAPPPGAVDLTCAYAALALVGPGARELLARFCALDARERSLAVGGFRPGSIARTPGYLLRPAEDELLLLVGWAYGEYLYDVVADAAHPLGGGPAGADMYGERADA